MKDLLINVNPIWQMNCLGDKNMDEDLASIEKDVQDGYPIIVFFIVVTLLGIFIAYITYLMG